MLLLHVLFAVAEINIKLLLQLLYLQNVICGGTTPSPPIFLLASLAVIFVPSHS